MQTGWLGRGEKKRESWGRAVVQCVMVPREGRWRLSKQEEGGSSKQVHVCLACRSRRTH